MSVDDTGERIAPDFDGMQWKRVSTPKSIRVRVVLALLKSAEGILFVAIAPILLVLLVFTPLVVAIAGFTVLPLLLGALRRVHRMLRERAEVYVEYMLVEAPKGDTVEITGYTKEGLPLYSTKLSSRESRTFMIVAVLISLCFLLLLALSFGQQ